MKLQKLVFFLHGWMLAIHDNEATYETFEVWPYGPVLPDLYDATKRFGALNINSYLPEYAKGQYVTQVVGPADKNFHSVFDQVWENYIGINALSLSTMTHQPGTPWEKAKQAKSPTISNQQIREYFLGLGNAKPE